MGAWKRQKLHYWNYIGDKYCFIYSVKDFF